MNTNKVVTAYIRSAPQEQQRVLSDLREMIRAALPQAREELGSSGFPVYTVNDNWVAGFATRKKAPMLYLMAPEVLDRYDDRLGKLRSGKSCIEFRATRDVPLTELRDLAGELLADVAAQNEQ